MARPRKNAKILELSGAFRHNPGRKRVRAAELEVKASIGDPPQDWLPPDRYGDAAAMLDAYIGTPEIAAALGVDEELVKQMRAWRSDRARFEALCRIWREIVEQDKASLCVLNVSHRMLLRNTCTLQHKIDRAAAGHGRATSGDYANLRAFLTVMGQTPASSAAVLDSVQARSGAVGDRNSAASGWGELVG